MVGCIKTFLILTVSFGLCSCIVIPRSRFLATDPNGNPLSGIKVRITSSEHLHLWADGASKPCHRMEGATDEEGAFYVNHTLVSQPAYFQSLFGAPSLPAQSLAFAYRDVQGNRLVSEVHLMPPGTDWAGVRDMVYFDGYEGQGAFVEIPATMGNTVGFVAASFGLVLAAPFDLVGAHNVGGGVAYYSYLLTCKPAGALMGAPFYCVKKVFWDGPRALLGLEGI